jgi:hypothetical protein
MNTYLLNLTFHAGSDDTEDTDKKLYLLQTNREITKETLKKDFIHTNKLLSPFTDENEKDVNLSASYENGLNIDTLIEGYAELTNDIIEELSSETVFPVLLSDYFAIEQWQ